MSTTTTRLSTDEADAAIAAIALDLRGLADDLDDHALDYLNAGADRLRMHAGDMAGAARMIGMLAGPLDALIAQLDREVDRAA